MREWPSGCDGWSRTVKKLARSLFALTLVLSAPGCVHRAARAPDFLTQFSVIDALLAGNYDGSLTCGELRRHGDFGIGTFDALDGEMTVLDGVVYAIRSDGRVEKVADSETTPFATVTFFDSDRVIGWSGGLSPMRRSKRISARTCLRPIIFLPCAWTADSTA